MVTPKLVTSPAQQPLPPRGCQVCCTLKPAGRGLSVHPAWSKPSPDSQASPARLHAAPGSLPSPTFVSPWIPGLPVTSISRAHQCLPPTRKPPLTPSLLSLSALSPTTSNLFMSSPGFQSSPQGPSQSGLCWPLQMYRTVFSQHISTSRPLFLPFPLPGTPFLFVPIPRTYSSGLCNFCLSFRSQFRCPPSPVPSHSRSMPPHAYSPLHPVPVTHCEWGLFNLSGSLISLWGQVSWWKEGRRIGGLQGRYKELELAPGATGSF